MTFTDRIRSLPFLARLAIVAEMQLTLLALCVAAAGWVTTYSSQRMGQPESDPLHTLIIAISVLVVAGIGTMYASIRLQRWAPSVLGPRLTPAMQLEAVFQ